MVAQSMCMQVHSVIQQQMQQQKLKNCWISKTIGFFLYHSASSLMNAKVVEFIEIVCFFSLCIFTWFSTISDYIELLRKMHERNTRERWSVSIDFSEMNGEKSLKQFCENWCVKSTGKRYMKQKANELKRKWARKKNCCESKIHVNRFDISDEWMPTNLK